MNVTAEGSSNLEQWSQRLYEARVFCSGSICRSAMGMLLTDAVGLLGPAIFAASYCCVAWITWRAARCVFDRTENLLWRVTSFALLALGLNKLFESTISNTLRVLAVEQGWYGERQAVQVGFVTSVITFFILASIIVLVSLKHAPASSWLASFGIMTLIALALVRDASLHQIDQMVSQRAFGLKLNWILDLGGLGLLVVASVWRRRPARP